MFVVFVDNYFPEQKYITIGKTYKVLNWGDDWISINGYLIRDDNGLETFYNEKRFIDKRKYNLNKIKKMEDIVVGSIVKFEEVISNQTYSLEGVITKIKNGLVYIDCNKYPWKCDRIVEVVRKIEDLC
jgi:hypothetical protein